MNKKESLFDDLTTQVSDNIDISEADKTIMLKNIAMLKNTKVNILITGATGCGKSSTINALFDENKAKVGMGVDPETMDIRKYELDNIVLYDSPGLGDGKEADRHHAKNIIDLLYKKDDNDELLIDLVLVILDGGSRDLGTSYELINEVIIPNLGEDKNRILVAINQCDIAMKGKNWDYENNVPMPKLINFLDEKVLSTKNRIKDATGVDVEPIYYSAGYQEEDGRQYPYNLSKLLLFILRHTKEEKRAIFAQDLNKNKEMWEKDDELEDYQTEIKNTILDSMINGATKGASIGASIGGIFGKTGSAIGSAIGSVVGGAVGFLTSFF